MYALLVVALGCLVAASPLLALRLRPASSRERRDVQLWTATASVLVIGMLAAAGAGYAALGEPKGLIWWAIGGVGAEIVVHVVARVTHGHGPAESAFGIAVQIGGVGVLGAVVVLVVLAGLEGPLQSGERDVAVATIVGAVAVTILAVPLRLQLRAYGTALRGTRPPSLVEAVATVSARMSRAVPMEEVFRQLAESLRATAVGTRVEIWTGTTGELQRTVSVPSSEAAVLHLGEQEQTVIARARIGGPAWTAVWLPSVHAGSRDHRVAPIVHLGDLLGLIVVHRPESSDVFTDADEEALVDIARRLRLALHNVRLDSALQASLEELAARNLELEQSRRRIVTAADASRREIERDLHDGAQQRLVALAVQLGLASETLEDESAETLRVLRDEVQLALADLRELAHGIYPPLLRDRGLPEALRVAAARSGVRAEVFVELPARYVEGVEAAVYFCCLEALQNAAKYGGSDVAVRVEASETDGSLQVEVADDGPGFDPATTPAGNGLTNMRDRVGALGGTVTVASIPGDGTRIILRLRAERAER